MKADAMCLAWRSLQKGPQVAWEDASGVLVGPSLTHGPVSIINDCPQMGLAKCRFYSVVFQLILCGKVERKVYVLLMAITPIL